jgi:hypothetical protein
MDWQPSGLAESKELKIRLLEGANSTADTPSMQYTHGEQAGEAQLQVGLGAAAP